jgi:hypothetical protein
MVAMSIQVVNFRIISSFYNIYWYLFDINIAFYCISVGKAIKCLSHRSSWLLLAAPKVLLLVALLGVYDWERQAVALWRSLSCLRVTPPNLCRVKVLDQRGHEAAIVDPLVLKPRVLVLNPPPKAV